MANRKMVYFTDDDQDDLDIMLEIGNAMGFDCKTFSHGADLLSEMHSMSRPDVVFLDIEMPRLNGYEVIAEMRSELEFVTIPFIIHTGNSDEVCIEKCLSLGATYFIQKQSSYTGLSDAISLAVGKNWLTHTPGRKDFVYSERTPQ